MNEERTGKCLRQVEHIRGHQVSSKTGEQRYYKERHNLEQFT
jgi:SRSO17 transposase